MFGALGYLRRQRISVARIHDAERRILKLIFCFFVRLSCSTAAAAAAAWEGVIKCFAVVC